MYKIYLFVFVVTILAGAVSGSARCAEKTLSNTGLGKRNLLRCALALTAGTSVTTAIGVALDGISDEPEPTQPNDYFGGYTRTLTEGNLVFIAKLVLYRLFPDRIGNASYTDAMFLEDLKMRPVDTLMSGVVLGPIMEELLCRGVPFCIFGDGWATGMAAATVFAGLHNITNKGFDFSRVPLTQFIGGVFYWYLIKYRGISHSIVAHAANNSMLAVIVYLETIYP